MITSYELWPFLSTKYLRTEFRENRETRLAVILLHTARQTKYRSLRTEP